MKMNSLDTITEHMKELSNPIRQGILKIVSEQGSISFTALKDELSLTDGSLYYHIKNLNKFLEKDEQNFYRLSDLGKEITNVLKGSPITETEEKSKLTKIIEKIGLSQLFYYLFGDPTRSLIEINLLLIVFAWIFGVSNEHFSSIEAILTGGSIVNSLISFAHWYLYLLIIFILLKILKKDFIFKELWIGVFIGIIPYFFYMIPVVIIHFSAIIVPTWASILLNIVFVICKIWSTLFVAQGIRLASKCNEYQSLIIACTLIFIDYLYLVIVMI